jgi:hypothetical protein
LVGPLKAGDGSGCFFWSASTRSVRVVPYAMLKPLFRRFEQRLYLANTHFRFRLEVWKRIFSFFQIASQFIK